MRGEHKSVVTLYRKAADNGHIEAMVKLADCYHCGYGNEENPVEAMNWG